MIIKIEGTRQQIAELAMKIRERGIRFEFVLRNPHEDIVKKRQCLVLGSDDSLAYYKLISPDEIYSTKNLQAQLPTHRNYFLKQVYKRYVFK